MGFYGNITNTARTQFQFDRVFANRHEMDLLMPTDGIYAGRFVLIEYDNAATKENFPTFFIDLNSTIEGCFYGYTNEQKSKASRICYTEDISQIGPSYPLNATKNDIFFDEKLGFFYVVTDGKEDFDDDGNLREYALFEKVASEADSAYVLNFNIDKAKYNTSRGYDSTVWQKVYANSEEKYVMVAELNTVVPTFDITVDAPTLAPINPHFDVSSTDVYYKLHMQPQWGFRVAAAANDDESDERVIWVKQQYNQKTDEIVDYYWDNEEEKWLPVDKESSNQIKDLSGAIYYNKAGFNPEIETKSQKQDKIAVLPTGESGQKYNTHDITNSAKPAKDIQELEIILPSLGNAVADMWNIVYGPGDEYNSYKRNTDIQWDSLDGIRLATTETGYQYNTNNIETLAGCINSVHDLMGMIIDEKPNNAAEAEDNRIYWDNSQENFVRKKKQYIYEEIPFESYDHEVVNVNEQNYLPYTYYFAGAQQGEFIPDEFGYYQEGKTYYGRVLKSNYLETDKMCYFEPNKYYYLNGKHYSLEINNTFAEDKKYFIISTEELDVYNFTGVYQKNKYYYSFGTDYYLETADTPIKEEYFIPNIVKVTKKPFESGGYYYEEGEKFHLYEGEFDSTLNYYISQKDPNAADNNTYIFTKVELFDPAQENYYQLVNNNFILTKIANNNDYYELTFYADGVYAKEQLYEPNKYFYVKNNDFIFATGNSYISKNTNYYIINPIPCVFYEINKYYIYNGTNYIIADSFSAEETYYTLGKDRYIKDDSKHSYAKGALWNNQIELVPYSVTLAIREVEYAFEELEGFAKNYNTIHGLILRLSYLLEDGDRDTRDTNTIQGALNYLNDIFAKFEALKPKTLLSVGMNGHIYPTTWTTKQGKNEEEEEENHWIHFNLDEVDHKIIIKHNNPKDGNHSTDKGTETDSQETFGRTFEVPHIDYDNMGHISAVGTHIVKMPIGRMDGLTATNSSVLTGISMDNTTGVITQTNNDIGNLVLTGFVKNTEGTLTSADSINNAFKTLESRIIDHEKELDTIVGEGTMKEAFDTLVEVSNWISTNSDAENANSLISKQNALELRIKELEDTIASLVGKTIFTVS